MSRLDNLGDYNVVRDDLQAHDGDVVSLYKDIGDTAVANARPGIEKKAKAEGVAIGATLGALVAFIIMGIKSKIDDYNQKKREKELIANETELKQRFIDVAKEATEAERVATESAE